LSRLIIAMASACYAGFFPWIPGTAGTAVGVLVYLLYSPFPPLLYLLSTGAFFVLAGWISGRAEVLLGQKDSPQIVIDEVVGFLIAMAFIPCNGLSIAGGFLFFRVLDIIKPPPANWVNREMKGGWAVVLDDAIAGVYANFLLRLTAVFYPGIFLD
jgi:phosphatidylglycerophosphatase A